MENLTLYVILAAVFFAFLQAKLNEVGIGSWNELSAAAGKSGHVRIFSRPSLLLRSDRMTFRGWLGCTAFLNVSNHCRMETSETQNTSFSVCLLILLEATGASQNVDSKNAENAILPLNLYFYAGMNPGRIQVPYVAHTTTQQDGPWFKSQSDQGPFSVQFASSLHLWGTSKKFKKCIFMLAVDSKVPSPRQKGSCSHLESNLSHSYCTSQQHTMSPPSGS